MNGIVAVSAAPTLDANPVLQIPFDQEDRRFLHEGMEDLVDSGFLTLGKWASQFEETFAAFAGSRYCVAVGSGTAALEVTLRALRVGGGSRIVPTNTFLATALASIHAGHGLSSEIRTPIPWRWTWPTWRGESLTTQGAVILVHIGGIMSLAWHELKRLCDQRGLHLIEDCAPGSGFRLR